MSVDRFSKLEVKSETGLPDSEVVAANLRQKKKKPVGQVDFDTLLSEASSQREAETQRVVGVVKQVSILLIFVFGSFLLASHGLLGMDKIMLGLVKFGMFVVFPVLVMRWLLKKDV